LQSRVELTSGSRIALPSQAHYAFWEAAMYSALVGSLILSSIGILMAHAMEGLFWLGDRHPIVVKNTVSLMRTPDYTHDASGS
jgi:hypothetical protein